MTDDRDLLILSAKAAGLKLLWTCGGIPVDVPTVWAGLCDRKVWNPLDDDGDALRLAVKLDIEIYQGDDDGPSVYAGYWGKPERRDVTRMFIAEPLGTDHYAATRRAIVRAAAEIGRQMGGER